MITEHPTIILLIFLVILAIAGWYHYRTRMKRHLLGEDEFIRGLMAIIENDFDSAIKFLKSAATKDTSNITAYLLLGDILRQRGDYEVAKSVHLSLLTRAFLKPDEKARIHKSLALDFAAEGNFKKALEHISQAVNLKPDRWSYEFMAEIYENLQMWDEAFSALAKIGGDKRVMALYKVKSAEKFFEDDPHKARVMLKEALKLDPDCVPAMIAIGDAYYSEERNRDALQWWEKVAVEYPQLAPLVLDKIEGVYYELGEFDRARILYRKILKTAPESEHIRLRLAQIYEKMGEIDSALQVINEAPNDTEALKLAKIRYNLMRNQTDRALQLLEDQLAEKSKFKIVCRHCGYESEELFLKCPQCENWNVLV